MCSISIIVPVYNVEKYLERCLDSIKRQTFDDFECILVDDGSSDSSLSICTLHASSDPRFKVIHIDNGGVSSARNRGLDEASGEWVGFVDSDDWVECDMYRSMYIDAIESGSDIVVAGVCGYNNGKNKKILSSRDALMTMFNPRSRMDGFSVTRLIRREIIGSIRYDENLGYLEDLNFFYRIYKKAKSVYWHDAPYYHYENRDESATGSYILSDKKRRGITALEDLSEGEKDPALQNRMNGFIYVWYLGTSINYASHFNTDAPEYSEMLRIIRDSNYRSLCTLRERLWRYIILHPWALKVYQALKKK